MWVEGGHTKQGKSKMQTAFPSNSKQEWNLLAKAQIKHFKDKKVGVEGYELQSKWIYILGYKISISATSKLQICPNSGGQAQFGDDQEFMNHSKCCDPPLSSLNFPFLRYHNSCSD